jgi:class 3 adenylate cyclase
MFCDLVGSTPLSGWLDPEDMRGIIGAYRRCVAGTVEDLGGFVARYMGDGALIYFGYPQAHEDDAERATRCGLALVDRVRRLSLGEMLHARVGIATGLLLSSSAGSSSMMSSAKRPISLLGCKPWPSPTQLSSPTARDGCADD